MKLVMTLMVRDEVDIIGAMLDHHAMQGVDAFIITDNGSVDGTVDLIEKFAADHDVDLRHDPVHRKQQASTVTQMARDAHALHGADWVINADADEFWIAVDRTRTLATVINDIPKSVGAFPVPVIDMTGLPAASGSGLSRLVYRDNRPVQELEKIGLHAHSTANVIHIGDPEVEVVQGNHFVNVAGHSVPDAQLAIEVLHLPWRSWAQFRGKVNNAGRAYDSNPDLIPSPNHHGMRDYRRLKDGTLLASYILRHPGESELAEGLSRGWLTEDHVLSGLQSISGHDVEFDADTMETQRAYGSAIESLEQRLAATKRERNALEEKLAYSTSRADKLEQDLQAQRNRRVARATDAVLNWRVGRRRG